MKSIFTALVSFLTNIIPTSKKIWAFNSYPDFTDNPYAFFIKVKDLKPENLFVWLISEKSLVRDIQKKAGAKNVRVYYKKSLKGMWYFFRSGFLFISHGIFEKYDASRSSKIVVNLWHGMPLKRICYMEPQTKWVTYSDYVIATSPLFQDIMGKSFRKDAAHTLLVGQPRNDLLFEKTDFFEKRNIDCSKYKKIGLWLPTYRHSKIQQRQDGEFHENQLLFLTVSDMKTLNESLANDQGLLIVKLHPMDALQDADLPSFSNLLILKQKDFDSQLYPLLGNADYLLTDYSSVWLDYEILNKPIGFVCDDFESYANDRGFTVDNLPSLMPGPILKNLEDVLNFVHEPIAPRNQEEGLFNKYKDNHSSDRLLSSLETLSK